MKGNPKITRVQLRQRCAANLRSALQDCRPCRRGQHLPRGDLAPGESAIAAPNLRVSDTKRGKVKGKIIFT